MKDRVIDAIKDCVDMSLEDRILIYNEATRELRNMVFDLPQDPALAPQIIRSSDLTANDYNPNVVATPEMNLLEDSIRADGVTMPVVTVHDPAVSKWVTVDGFHRQLVLKERLHREYVTCSVIDTDVANRVASTIRHNRARGKHQVDLMAQIVKILLREGWTDENISTHLGMTVEELLRLKQTVGIAEVLAGSEYSKSWGVIDESDLPDGTAGQPSIDVAR
jgi:ParB-like chromosome segregation protein Spo0J